jgi:hypothetical protein
MRHSPIGLAVFMVTLAVCANATEQRPPMQRPVTLMSLPVSSSVLATIVSADNELTLLVLWRGEKKDWHSTGPRHESGGGRNGIVTVALQYGDVQLDLRFDPAESQAIVEDRTISMPAGSNVLLVDGVDSSKGVTSVRALTLDAGGANLDPRKGSLAPLLGRSSRSRRFPAV